MDDCESTEVKERYSSYISTLPVISLDGGTYDSKEEVDFSAIEDGTKIYLLWTAKTRIPPANCMTPPAGSCWRRRESIP